jgi:hypothetical protein
MKRILIIWCLLIFQLGLAQAIWENNIDGNNLSNSNPYTTGDVRDPNVTVSGIGYGSGLTAGNFPNSYTTNGWNSNTLNVNQYFEFTITPNTGYKIDFTEFIGNVARNSSSRGPTTFELRSSVDNYASTIGVSKSFPSSVVQTDLTVSLGASFQSIGTSITFRLYAYGSGFNGFSDFSVENFKFKGSVYKTIWTNPITGTNPSASDPYITGDVVDGNITVSGIRRGPGIVARTTANRYDASGWNAPSINGLKYFEFTLSPKAGYKINLASLVFNGTANAVGPTSFALQSSIDDFDSTIGIVVAGANTINLTDNSFQNITGTITFRLYAWNASSAVGTFGINDFTFNGTVVSATSSAQSIWTNPITAANPSSANPYTNGDVKDPNITVSGIGRGNGITARTTANRYDATGWNSSNINGQDYFEFTLTPNSGYKINLTSFVFDGQTATAAAPGEFALQSSIDGFTSQINVVEDLNSIDLTNAIFQNITAPITFRLYAWGASAASGRYGVNSFAFNGAVVVDATLVQSIWSNPIVNANPSASNPYANGDVKNANITVSGIGRGSGIVPRTTVNRYDATGWNSSNIDLQDYYEFTLNPNSGYAINFNSFVFDGQSASISAPVNFALHSNVDNFVSDIGVVLDDSNTIDLTNVAYQNITGSITFRIYAWGGSDANGRYGINQFFFKGTVVPCVSPTITTTGVATPVCFSPSGQNTTLSYTATTGSPNSFSIDWDTAGNSAGLVDVSSTAFTFAISGGTLSIAIPAGLIGNTYAGIMTISAGSCTATQAITLTINGSPAALVLNDIVLTCNQTSANGTWAAIPNISDYRFDVSLDSSFATFVAGYQDVTVAPSASPTESVTVNGLTPGVTYFARARAVSTCGTSVNSNIATISVPITRTFDGVSWDNGLPDTSKKAIFTGNAIITTPLNACSCQINPGVNVVVGVSGETNDTAILKIENGLTVDPTSTLTFENNSSLIQVNDAVVNTGTIIYKRISSPMKNFDFTYWSSPVKDQVLNVLSPNTFPDKYFSFANNNWVLESGANMMNPAGKGFIIRVPKPNSTYPNGKDNWTTPTYAQPVQFVGVPYNGAITIATQGPSQTNLIGNPYPSAIDADLFMTNTNNSTTIDGALYFWTHNSSPVLVGSSYVYVSNDYAVYNLTGGTEGAPTGGPAPSGQIAAGQSFFVGSQVMGNFEFNNSMRISDAGSNAQFYKMSKTKKGSGIEKNRVWLKLTNAGGAFKQLLVGYIAGATNDIDKLYDAVSFDGNAYIDFYSVNNGNSYAIQGRAVPFDVKDEVSLGYKSTIEGPFEIGIEKRDGILANQEIWLEDKKTAITHDLTNVNYSFMAIKGIENDRFVLKYTNKTLGTNHNKILDEAVDVYVKNKKITIVSKTEAMQDVFIYDLRGRLLYSNAKIGSNEFLINYLISGDRAIIFKIKLQNEAIYTKKIIF